MKNKFNQIIVIAILVFSVLGCSALRQIPEMFTKTLPPKDFVSTDGKVRLTAPGNWRVEKNLNDQAVLQIAYPLQELYAIIIPDEKASLPKGTDLDSFTEMVRGNMEKALSDPVIKETTSTTVNGFEARRFEMQGEFNKIKGLFVFTLVDTPDAYYQIMSWTMDSMAKKNKPKLLEVSDTFDLAGNPKNEKKSSDKK